MNIEELRAINAFATQGLMPDLTLLLDIPQQESRQRVAGRSGKADRFEQEREAFHLRLAEGFRALAAAETQRIRRIDSTTPQALTAEAVWTAVRPLLP